MGGNIMRAHVIKDGKVINTIVVDSLRDRPNLIEAKEGGPGWLYDGEKLIEPEPTPIKKAPEDRTISDLEKRVRTLEALQGL
jgi:hypothetical protein